MEAIILAGGLGTRLRSEVQDMPKAMASINSRPFLEYLLDFLVIGGITRVIISVGHKSEHIINHFSNEYKGLEIVYAIEEKRLGTGGAIKFAMEQVLTDNVLIMNGDSVFMTNIKDQFEAHEKANADITMALKPMVNIERYGTIALNEENRVTEFKEKQFVEEGLVNTGTYIFKVSSFKSIEFPEIFSIEKEFFESHLNRLFFLGTSSNGYFLDIGIPVDFKKAQTEIGVFTKIDSSWTLFLDRDGVINKKIDNDYVKTLDELEILPGAIEAIVDFSKIFGRVVIVTNQQGIGKGLMSVEDLNEIHNSIVSKVEKLGGKVDAVYFAPQLVAEKSKMRKPEIGMALKAKDEFPEIDFAKSIMVGDSPSDIEFGRKANMIPILVGEKKNDQPELYAIPSLAYFREMLNSILNS